jgi:hypothetical protein
LLETNSIHYEIPKYDNEIHFNDAFALQMFLGILQAAGIKICHSNVPVLSAVISHPVAGKPIITTTKFRNMTRNFILMTLLHYKCV